jgi:hypothetical protein
VSYPVIQAESGWRLNHGWGILIERGEAGAIEARPIGRSRPSHHENPRPRRLRRRPIAVEVTPPGKANVACDLVNLEVYCLVRDNEQI